MLNPIDYLAIASEVAAFWLIPLILTVGILRAMDRMGWINDTQA